MEMLFPKIQFGLKVGGGSVIAVHCIQAALQAAAGNMALFADVRNAFNETHRKAIARALADKPETRALWHLVCAAYGDVPSPLLVRNRSGLCAVIDSQRGVRQGDVLASFLFALVMQPVYESALEAGGGRVTGVAVLDDFTVVWPSPDVAAVFQEFSRGCQAVGLSLALDKCSAMWPGEQPSLEDRDLITALGGAGTSQRSTATVGVAVERWLFFAEAKHTVTLYYGTTGA